MITTTHNRQESSIYPGIYTPAPRAYAQTTAQGTKLHKQSVRTPVNRKKNKDFVVLELLLPDCNKQDICIDGHKRLLSVYIPQRSANNNTAVRNSNNAGETYYFQQYISLPPDADGAFANAAYENGLLSIYIPVTATPLNQQKPYRIVVY